MKSFIKGIFSGTDVGQEDLDLGVWPRPISKESPQTIRNVGHIDQLEAGQADLKKNLSQVYQILSDLRSSQWATSKPRFHMPHTSWQKFLGVNIAEIPFDLDEGVIIWQKAKHDIQLVDLTIDQIGPPYHEKLTTVTKLFGELEEDFDELPNRIVRCELLEKELSAFEESLEGDETECLAWCVSLIRDVLDYNNAENLTETHLGLLKRAIKLIAEKGPDCNKEDYKNLHKEFLEAGIALIPTTQKAIDRYGQ